MSGPAPVQHAAVIGAGTMGAGIAQVLATAGADVHLVDLELAALDRATQRIRDDLDGAVERGRMQAVEAASALSRLHVTTDFDAVGAAELVVEAVVEDAAVKAEVLGRAGAVTGGRAVMATNTSSLLVSDIAARVDRPDRVVGMHFFNPVPRMRLVEVIPGVDTDEAVVQLAEDVVAWLGKRSIAATDGIGFIVNRCGRPFYGEALKLAQEGIASTEQIDRVCRVGGGFRMGPFELIDLVGVDVNLAIARSFFEQSFGEPRWRPNALQARLVAAGRTGRKSGRGFYDYAGGPHRPPDPVRSPTGGDGRAVHVEGDDPIADRLRDALRGADFALPEDASAAWLVLDCRLHPTHVVEGSVPRAVLCAATSLRRRGDASAVGFHTLALPDARAVEVTASATTDPEALRRTEECFAALGYVVEHVGDAPGLVLGRIVAQLVNEAAFAQGEAVGTAEDLEVGVTVGLNHPNGPAGWTELVGPEYVSAVIDGLHRERREERYRLAPNLIAAPAR